MITKFKIFENKPLKSFWKEEFSDLENIPYKTFDLRILNDECKEHNVYFFDLLKEIILDRKIIFKCYCCLDESFEYVDTLNHNVIGKCLDVQFEDVSYQYSDIAVKIENDEFDDARWHAIFFGGEKDVHHNKVRVYNYKEGPEMKRFNMLKNMKKFNL